MRRAAALALLAAVVAGCGGGDALSPSEYRAKANAICTTIRSERDRITPAQNLEQLRAAARTTIAINTEALGRFKDLEPPDELKDAHETIVSNLEKTIGLQQRAVEADSKSKEMEKINFDAAAAHGAMVKAAQQAKLAACTKL